MSAWWQFKALMRKNILTLKRSIFMTLIEIFYPIGLMLVCYLIKLAFDSTKVTWEDEEGLEQYLVNKGNYGFDYSVYPHLMNLNNYLKLGQLGSNPLDYVSNYLTLIHSSDSDLQTKLNNLIANFGSGTWEYVDPLDETHDISVSTIGGLPAKPITMICIQRLTIAFVGFEVNSQLGQAIISYINIELLSLKRVYNYKYFESIDELNNYITAEDYGKDDKPTICFGIYFKQNGNKDYSASLHYFNDPIQHGNEDVPNNLRPVNEEMQQGPNMNDVKKYSDDGYIQMLNILANYILKDSDSTKDGYINYGFAIQKYDSYKFNDFAAYAGVYYTFFAILSYLCPLILYVLKMVVEKESRSKEVMKIMGMGEGTYFLSYFVEYFIVNIIYAFALAFISKLTFHYIPYLVFVLYLWLFGLNIFALAFFCQSFCFSCSI